MGKYKIGEILCLGWAGAMILENPEKEEKV
jgi:hypothetical protein